MKKRNIRCIKQAFILVLLTVAAHIAVKAQSIATGNMALNKTTVSSSSAITGLGAGNAFDGDLYTRFSSSYDDNQWISVDLGRSYLVDTVILIWEQAYGKDFDILFSVTGSFTDLNADSIQIRKNVLTGNIIAGTNKIKAKPNTVARYVRMQGIHRATSYGYSLYEFQVAGSAYVSNLLPVTLTGFTAAAGNNTTILEWATTTEYNNAGFSIERSSDGTNFTAIGWVNGNNAGTVTSHYSFTDNQSFSGRNYYRLKIINLAGTAAYSTAVAISAVGSTSVKLYPVPVKDHIMIEYRGTARENITVSLLNATGQPVYNNRIALQGGQQTMMINRTGSMTPGSYFLTISSTENKQSTTQIFLQ